MRHRTGGAKAPRRARGHEYSNPMVIRTGEMYMWLVYGAKVTCLTLGKSASLPRAVVFERRRIGAQMAAEAVVVGDASTAKGRSVGRRRQH
jgi:hypothetical protein